MIDRGRRFASCVSWLSRVIVFVAAMGVGAPEQRAVAAEAQPVIYLIGVQHAPGLLLSESLSPGHVRAALDAIDPDVVGVESNPEWFARGQHYAFTYEAFAVAVPWAKANGRPVVGTDWIGDDSGHWSQRQRRARVEREFANLEIVVDPAQYGYGLSRADQRRALRAGSIPSFARLNGPEHAAERIAWLDGGKHTPGSAQAYIAERDARIADHIAAAAGRVARMAVVIGADHVGNVTRELRAQGLGVGDLRAVLVAASAPWDGSADAALSATDVAASLIQSIDGDLGVAMDPERETRLLAALERLVPDAGPEVRDWLGHIQAKRAWLAGDEQRAVELWTGLAHSDRSTAFPYVGDVWRHRLSVAQLARLELGRAADLRGEREAALGHYRALLETLKVPEFSLDEHSDFELLARAHNAVRALTHVPYRHEFAFATAEVAPAQVAPRAAAEAPRAELQSAWEHLRSRRWNELDAAVAKLDEAGDLPFLEALEHHFLAMIAALERGRIDDAKLRLAVLERDAAQLEADHWLRRELPGLRARVER